MMGTHTKNSEAESDCFTISCKHLGVMPRAKDKSRLSQEPEIMETRTRNPTRPVSLASSGISHVGLKVSDLEESRKFYHEVLGLRDELRKPGTVYLQSGSDLLVLHVASTRMSDLHFGFRVDKPSQVDEWREWLKSNNVTIFEDNTEGDNYHNIKIRDPDGHWIEISYRR